MGLKIYDEFLEDDTILGLQDRSYRLHVSALIYCAKNLTDGEVNARGVKVLQILLGFQARKQITELVDAGLWVPDADGGFRIKNYLEFNPDAETVKAERKAARERMRKLRAKRARGDSPERSPERDGERSPAVPDQAFPDLEVQEEPGRQFADESLPFSNELLVARLMQRIGDQADQGTRQVVVSYARRLPQASLAKVIESIETQSPRDRAAYAVGALRDELGERAA